MQSAPSSQEYGPIGYNRYWHYCERCNELREFSSPDTIKCSCGKTIKWHDRGSSGLWTREERDDWIYDFTKGMRYGWKRDIVTPIKDANACVFDPSLFNTWCGCEPCPMDIRSIFNNANIEYEDSKYRGCGCDWHIVAILPNGMRITPGGEDTLWVETRADLSEFAEPKGHGAFIVKVTDSNRLGRYKNAKPIPNL